VSASERVQNERKRGNVSHFFVALSYSEPLNFIGYQLAVLASIIEEFGIEKMELPEPLRSRYTASVVSDWNRPSSQLKYGFYECNPYEQNSEIPTDILTE